METPKVFLRRKIIVNYWLLGEDPHATASIALICRNDLLGTDYDLVEAFNKAYFLGPYLIDESVICNVNHFATL